MTITPKFKVNDYVFYKKSNNNRELTLVKSKVVSVNINIQEVENEVKPRILYTLGNETTHFEDYLDLVESNNVFFQGV